MIFIALAIIIKTLSFFPEAIEKYYTYGFYSFFSKLLRLFTGWIPFSIGDVFYSLLIAYIIYQLIVFIRNFRKYFHLPLLKKALLRIAFIGLGVYVIFYSFWGLNYYRTGISGQLGLKDTTYSSQDLDTLITLLQQQLNTNAAQLTGAMRDSFANRKNLFENGIQAYKSAESKYPFLKYNMQSVKPLLFSYLMNYWGVQGYYNPFTGEAQVNTTIPVFILPFVVSHEMSHQLGYGKENEANFVSYIVNKTHPSVLFRYSEYLELYDYSWGELRLADSIRAIHFDSLLHPTVIKDLKIYKAFYEKYRSPIQPVINWIYGNYLKANNQPAGNRSYSEVVRWLIAYYKKYGKEAI